MQQNENDKNDKNKLYSQTIVQGRLTKSEWNNMEIPVSSDELTVIKLIRNSYHNVQLKMNHNSSMIGILKTSSSPEMHAHLYQKHFENIVSECVKTYKLPEFSFDAGNGHNSNGHNSNGHNSNGNKNSKNKITEIKKIDAIRIKNNESAINPKNIFEYTILKICKLLLSKKAKWDEEKDVNNDSDSDSEDDDDIDGCSWMSYYYALKMNMKNSMIIKNKYSHMQNLPTPNLYCILRQREPEKR